MTTEYDGYVKVVAPDETKARLLAASAMHLASDRIDHVVDAGASTVPGCRDYHFFTKD
jgi:hypothetical protein